MITQVDNTTQFLQSIVCNLNITLQEKLQIQKISYETII